MEAAVLDLVIYQRF